MAFGTILSDPGSEKSGEYLSARIVAVARNMIARDREAVIAIMRSWLRQRKLPHTLLAVDVAKELRLRELTEELVNLRDAISTGEWRKPYYVAWVDAALAQLKG